MDKKQQTTTLEPGKWDVLLNKLEEAKTEFKLQWQLSDKDAQEVNDGIKAIKEYQQSLAEEPATYYSRG
jgi:type II secretory pathway component PulJ